MMVRDLVGVDDGVYDMLVLWGKREVGFNGGMEMDLGCCFMYNISSPRGADLGV